MVTAGRLKSGETAVTLEPVSWDAHGSLLATWLGRPHVSRWWIETDRWLDRTRETPACNHAVIAVSGSPVGYIRWQTADREVLDELGLSAQPHPAGDAGERA
jgi:hypothetical protein